MFVLFSRFVGVAWRGIVVKYNSYSIRKHCVYISAAGYTFNIIYYLVLATVQVCCLHIDTVPYMKIFVLEGSL